MAHDVRIEGEHWREERVKLLARRAGELDGYTWAHSLRVAELAHRLGQALGYDEEQCAALRYAGMLHDVGKLAVPTALLLKPAPLSRAERRVVQRHATASERLARWIGHADMVTVAVRQHHERWDGTGYPDRVSGESITHAARVLALANAYDALTSERCYRAAIGPATALEVIAADAGHAFDPALVAAALPVLRDWGARRADGGPAARAGLAPRAGAGVPAERSAELRRNGSEIR